MKKFLALICTALLSVNLWSQLPDGSLAPDFTAEDINGNSWNLYSILGDGKVVVLNFFTTWDNYSWQYQQTGALQDFYEAYGPDGTNEVIVLNIESEPGNAQAQLSGPQNISGNYSDQTYGDWISGITIPIIDQAFVADSFQVAYIPTMLMICPNGAIWEVDQVAASELYDEFYGLSCPTITEGLDPAVLDVEIFADCGSSFADITIGIQNLGSTILTEFNYSITGLMDPFVATWNGTLNPYGETIIQLNDVELNSEGHVLFMITSVDDNDQNNFASASSSVGLGSLQLQLELNLDQWPEEVSWEIRNDQDEVIFSDGDFEVSYEYFNDTFTLPDTGCYSLYLYDSGGDGLHGSQWGGFDGSCRLSSLNEDGEVVSYLYDYDGSYNFSSVLPSLSFQKTQFRAITDFNSLPSITDGLDPAALSIEVFRDCDSDTADLLVSFQNVGTYLLRDFDYEITGLTTNIQDSWSGNLFTFQNSSIQIQDVVPDESGHVIFTITSSDDDAGNNVASALSHLAEVSLNLQLELMLDDSIQEVSWEIRNDQDEVIFSDGNFSGTNHYFNEVYSMPADGCYSFYLYDSFGDGLHGSQWGGVDGYCYLRSLYGDGSVREEIYANNGSYNFSTVTPSMSFEKVQFNAQQALNVNDIEPSGMTCYPNPANQFVQINMGELDASEVSLDIYDLTGKLVIAKPIGSFKYGQKSLTVDTNDLNEGYYHIKITSGNRNTVVPLLIIH